MSGGGGSGSDRGGNDMQVSGAEAAYSTEKGISTAADTKISDRSFSPGGRDEPNYGYGEGKVDPGFQQANTSPRADTSTVGIAAPDSYSDSEIEKGYTDEGEKLSNVNGVYMTKSEMYNKGIVEKDPNTGEEVMGRNRVNPITGELERADLSFAEHFANSPVKFSPTLSFLYASGKNPNMGRTDPASLDINIVFGPRVSSISEKVSIPIGPPKGIEVRDFYRFFFIFIDFR